MRVLVKQLHNGSEKIEINGKVLPVPEEYSIKDSDTKHSKIVGNIMKMRKGDYFYTVLMLDKNNRTVVFSASADTVKEALEKIKREVERRSGEQCVYEYEGFNGW